MPGRAVTTPDASLNQQLVSQPVPAGYALRPADVIRVQVFREADLSLDSVVIAADGTVSFPLVGEMQVAGLTPVELENQLEARLGARYLRDPSVAVNIISYGSHLVTVEGSVTQPGIYPFQPGTRLSGGIALARGPTRVANQQEIAVFRQTPDGMEIAKFDLAAVRAGTMLDPVLMPGDRIVVGKDNLSQFWQDVLQALPALGIFTRF
ncbi:MAG: polysaccharide export protein [Alteraurantiacibacter sp.]|nr:polysaccharide export protein [Alteraurantiacibacter sp.]